MTEESFGPRKEIYEVNVLLDEVRELFKAKTNDEAVDKLLQSVELAYKLDLKLTAATEVLEKDK